MCDPNASCVKGADGEFVCVCNRNFRGDGRRCSGESGFSETFY